MRTKTFSPSAARFHRSAIASLLSRTLARLRPTASPMSHRWTPIGTIYPGLIELHNHITYNILKLWNVPVRFPIGMDGAANQRRFTRRILAIGQRAADEAQINAD